MNRVTTNHPDLDDREGSIIFNALAGAAAELAIAYIALNNVLGESFVETASREYILRGCKDMGIDVSIFDANAGTFKGEFNVEVPIGSRWNCDLYNYVVTAQMESTNEYYAYTLECESTGSAPNVTTGALTAITDVPNGLEHAELVECLILGEDEYTDAEIVEYYYNFVNSVASDGNIGQYERWAEDFDGIGHYRVFPLWNGANTVKVSILDAANRSASETLIQEFQTYLDPGTTGMGDGIAPIGAFVTVSTANEATINVSANVKLRDGYTSVPDINSALANYFGSIAYSKSQLSYMSVGAAILAVPGVDFISDLLINGGTADILLGDEVIPVLGTTNWTVVK
jgi:uncharacterized phage protein gp47/JayE